MAIDYVIGYDCVPKTTLGTGGILERLKARERAAQVIRLFRENGDQRPPSEMGFEFSRTAADGTEETRVIVVQELLNDAAQLDPLAVHCVGCPANARKAPFGCMNYIQYPISLAAERWLLDRLPGIDEPLIWLMLKQGITELGYDGAGVAPLRSNGTYFEEGRLSGRDLVEFVVNANQVFHMLFLTGHIQPSHAGVLLLLFGAIRRDLEAHQVVLIMNRSLPADQFEREFPFVLTPDTSDDDTIAEFKQFFYALHRAYVLNVPVLLDV
ncbi:MAG: hypothetical protein IAE80_14770 [Anaerolinea sp.]|nr:hypothetical protein [Anaerolinea sp.]